MQLRGAESGQAESTWRTKTQPVPVVFVYEPQPPPRRRHVQNKRHTVEQKRSFGAICAKTNVKPRHDFLKLEFSVSANMWGFSQVAFGAETQSTTDLLGNKCISLSFLAEKTQSRVFLLCRKPSRIKTLNAFVITCFSLVELCMVTGDEQRQHTPNTQTTKPTWTPRKRPSHETAVGRVQNPPSKQNDTASRSFWVALTGAVEARGDGVQEGVLWGQEALHHGHLGPDAGRPTAGWRSHHPGGAAGGFQGLWAGAGETLRVAVQCRPGTHIYRGRGEKKQQQKKDKKCGSGRT